MDVRKKALAAMAASFLTAQSAQALPIWNNGYGHEWRQLTETTGLTYDQLSTQAPKPAPVRWAGWT